GMCLPRDPDTDWDADPATGLRPGTIHPLTEDDKEVRRLLRNCARSGSRIHVVVHEAMTTDERGRVPLAHWLPPGLRPLVVEHRAAPHQLRVVNWALRESGVEVPRGGALVLPGRPAPEGYDAGTHSVRAVFLDGTGRPRRCGTRVRRAGEAAAAGGRGRADGAARGLAPAQPGGGTRPGARAGGDVRRGAGGHDEVEGPVPRGGRARARGAGGLPGVGRGPAGRRAAVRRLSAGLPAAAADPHPGPAEAPGRSAAHRAPRFGRAVDAVRVLIPRPGHATAAPARVRRGGRGS